MVKGDTEQPCVICSSISKRNEFLKMKKVAFELTLYVQLLPITFGYGQLTHN